MTDKGNYRAAGDRWSFLGILIAVTLAFALVLAPFFAAILWAVIAAILPMAFVDDLMGPYMRPIPIGSTAAMLFSLAIAFTVTPWAAIRVLRRHLHKAAPRGTGLPTREPGAATATTTPDGAPET